MHSKALSMKTASIGVHLAAVLGASAALAQSSPPYDVQRFKAAVADPQTIKAMEQAALSSTVMIRNPCPTAQYQLDPAMGILQNPAFDTGQMISGAWKFSVDMKGCGVSRRLNGIAFVKGPKTLGTAAIAPGTTHADFKLQKDSGSYAFPAAVAKLSQLTGPATPPCKDGYLADTAFVAHDAPTSPATGGKGPPWHETWTVNLCGYSAEVTMNFIPDATGTTIATGPIKLTPLATH